MLELTCVQGGPSGWTEPRPGWWQTTDRFCWVLAVPLRLKEVGADQSGLIPGDNLGSTGGTTARLTASVLSRPTRRSEIKAA